MQRLYKLEAVRGLCAFYVVLHHTILHTTTINGVNVGFLLRFGQEAVILFFLLSGFVINYSFRNSSDQSFGTYFFKRSARIYIPLAFIFLLGYLGESYNKGALINPDLWTLLKNILMLQDWGEVKPNVLADPYMGNIPLWSLHYEWWFYMLYFPITTRLGFGFRPALVVFILCAAMAGLYVWYPHAVFRLFTYFGIWWAGVYLSEIYMQGRHRLLKPYLLPLGGLFVLSVIVFIPVWIARSNGQGITLGLHPLVEFRHVFTAFLVLVGALVWQRLRWFGFDLFVKPFFYIAPISYVLYICHQPLMVQATYLDSIDNGVLRWFCYLAIVFAFSYLLELKIYPRMRNAIRARLS